eukprot:scpid62458/ scgid8107/ 
MASLRLNPKLVAGGAVPAGAMDASKCVRPAHNHWNAIRCPHTGGDKEYCEDQFCVARNINGSISFGCTGFVSFFGENKQCSLAYKYNPGGDPIIFCCCTNGCADHHFALLTDKPFPSGLLPFQAPSDRYYFNPDIAWPVPPVPTNSTVNPTASTNTALRNTTAFQNT